MGITLRSVRSSLKFKSLQVRITKHAVPAKPFRVGENQLVDVGHGVTAGHLAHGVATQRYAPKNIHLCHIPLTPLGAALNGAVREQTNLQCAQRVLEPSVHVCDWCTARRGVTAIELWCTASKSPGNRHARHHNICMHDQPTSSVGRSRPVWKQRPPP